MSLFIYFLIKWSIFTHLTSSVSLPAVSFWRVWDTQPVKQPYGFLKRCWTSVEMKVFVRHVSPALFTCENCFYLTSFCYLQDCAFQHPKTDKDINCLLYYLANNKQTRCVKSWQIHSKSFFSVFTSWLWKVPKKCWSVAISSDVDNNKRQNHKGVFDDICLSHKHLRGSLMTQLKPHYVSSHKRSGCIPTIRWFEKFPSTLFYFKIEFKYPHLYIINILKIHSEHNYLYCI